MCWDRGGGGAGGEGPRWGDKAQGPEEAGCPAWRVKGGRGSTWEGCWGARAPRLANGPGRGRVWAQEPGGGGSTCGSLGPVAMETPP